MATKASDVVIMPVNAGANLIRQGADYKLVSIAVDGSLYVVGNTEKAVKSQWTTLWVKILRV